MSDPQGPHVLQPSRLLHPWDFPGKSAGVGAIAFSGQLSNDTETIRCCLVAGVQPRWIQGDSKVGTESASLEKYIFNHRYREIRNG